MFHTFVMMAGQVEDHFVGAQGVAGQYDVFIAFFLCKSKICLYILVCIGETFVP